jgi:ubiquinone/menaquinone biosynthesis C-methylase UbiE
LQAKEPVDERARNERVWTEFLRELTNRGGSPLRILEVGAGAGATAARILQALRDHPVAPVEYTLVDVAADHLTTVRERLREWATDHGYNFVEEEGGATIAGSPPVTLRFVAADLFDFGATQDHQFDAIVAQAVLDILPLEQALASLRGLLRQEGLWYLPIHFDGVTAFEPRFFSDLDAQIEQLYHSSMSGEAGEEGDSAGAQTGRRLLTRFQESDSTLLSAGSSDWVIFARNGAYAGDEAYFLHHVVHFIEAELTGHPALNEDAFEQWIAERRRQIERGELIYVAHQLDVLAREGGP